MNSLILGIAEWQYIIASSLASFIAFILLRASMVERDELESTGENGSLGATVKKALWRYRIMLATALIKVAIGVIALLGLFSTLGFLFLTIQPDILLLLLWHEWRSDKRIIRMRKEEEEYTARMENGTTGGGN